MSAQIRQSLTCAATIVAQLFLAGCGSRRDDSIWTWSQAPTRVASNLQPGVQSPVALDPIDQSDMESGAPSESGANDERAPTDSDPLTDSPARSPRAVLEAAGAIIEQNAQGQPAGVNLSGAQISTELMQAVGQLGEIQWLDLRGARVSDEHLAVLGQLPRLQLLALGDTQVTDEGLRSIQGLKELRFLSLDRTLVSDVGLMRLAGMPKLEGVSLQGTRVSQAGATSFENQTPRCTAIIDDDAPAESPVSTPTESSVPFPGEPTSSSDGESPRSTHRESPLSSPVPQRVVSNVTDVEQTRQQLALLLQQKLLDPEILEALGQHLLAERNYHQAARAYEAVLTLQPDNLRAHYGLARARARVGAFDAALPHFVAVVGDATAHYNLGVIAYESQQPEVSERFFQQALSREADFDEARHWLAYIRREKAVTPASHALQPFDEQGLVNLLISEFGRVSTPPADERSGSEIEIVPAVKSASPDRP